MADVKVVVPDKLRLLSGTTELASLEADTDFDGVHGGLLVCRDSSGNPGVALTGDTGINIFDGSLQFYIQGSSRVLVTGVDKLSNQEGGIIALKASGDPTVGPVGTGAIVLNAAKRTLVICSANGQSRVELGAGGNLVLGGGDTFGEIVLRDKYSNVIGRLGGDQTNLTLGGEGHDADLLLRNKGGETRIHIDADRGGPPSPTATVYVDGRRAAITLGNNGQNGDLFLADENGKTRIQASAMTPMIKLMSANGDVKVKIDGDSGDITLPNSDCAEDFTLVAAESPDPGNVMVIDAEGALRMSSEAYDRKVVGVLSGAGDLRPGLVLGRTSAEGKRMPLALVGKVYCKVDAGAAPIEVGDLLTTSSTPGHAMKASDAGRAFGAVIGKALCPVANGTSLIPILVALQ